MSVFDQFFAAIQSNDKVAMCEFMDLYGFLVNCEYEGITPLTIACEFSNIEIIEILIQRGAEINTHNNLKYGFPFGNEEKYSPLLVACIYRRPEVVKILLLNGAFPCKLTDQLYLKHVLTLLFQQATRIINNEEFGFFYTEDEKHQYLMNVSMVLYTVETWETFSVFPLMEDLCILHALDDYNIEDLKEFMGKSRALPDGYEGFPDYGPDKYDDTTDKCSNGILSKYRKGNQDKGTKVPL